MKQTLVLIFTGLFLTFNAHASEVTRDELKAQIVALAETFSGQGDPDFSKQNQLEPLVRQLLEIAPQSSIQARLPLLAGAWRQVWGPYDYRNDDRGVDPELGVEEIYQVISSEGYYHNVSYLYKDGDRQQKRIGLLRGEYSLTSAANTLEVQFTDYPGASSKSDDLQLWQLPELAEAEVLPNRITIVPSIIVRLFFGGGNLREVYTDEDLRITYGSSKRSPQKESIYIMTRVQ